MKLIQIHVKKFLSLIKILRKTRGHGQGKKFRMKLCCFNVCVHICMPLYVFSCFLKTSSVDCHFLQSFMEILLFVPFLIPEQPLCQNFLYHHNQHLTSRTCLKRSVFSVLLTRKIETKSSHKHNQLFCIQTDFLESHPLGIMVPSSPLVSNFFNTIFQLSSKFSPSSSLNRKSLATTRLM